MITLTIIGLLMLLADMPVSYHLVRCFRALTSNNLEECNRLPLERKLYRLVVTSALLCIVGAAFAWVGLRGWHS